MTVVPKTAMILNGLFDDCVFYDPTCTSRFILGRVKGFAKKESKDLSSMVVDISNKPANVARGYCI